MKHMFRLFNIGVWPWMLLLLCISFLAATETLLNMWHAESWLSTIGNFVTGSDARNEILGQCHSSEVVDLGWYPPNSTTVNNLEAVVNGTGIYGFIFNSSTTPPNLPYSTYNWCNAPHVRSVEYEKAPAEYKLEYVEVIHRHHKRTPYAANTFPEETYSWYCDDEALFYHSAPEPEDGSAMINWKVYNPSWSPYAVQGFNGTCQFPQISAGGLYDSRQHGKDLYSVYHDLLGFLPDTLDPSRLTFRVSNNVITSQVAGQVLIGMYPDTNHQNVQVLVQPASIDSVTSSYPCDAATRLYASYGVGGNQANWTMHLRQSSALFKRLDAISGIASDNGEWHKWFDHYFDNLSARLCHDKALPCAMKYDNECILMEDAEAVFRRGEYEYSFIYRDSPQSLAAAAASYGVWMAELAFNLRTAINKESPVIYHHNVGHDESMAKLLSFLQIDLMVWPPMGSEVVFELYSRSECWYVRVLWSGQIMRSSNPSLGFMNMLPVESLLDYIDGLVGVHAAKVPALCSRV